MSSLCVKCICPDNANFNPSNQTSDFVDVSTKTHWDPYRNRVVDEDLRLINLGTAEKVNDYRRKIFKSMQLALFLCGGAGICVFGLGMYVAPDDPDSLTLKKSVTIGGAALFGSGMLCCIREVINYQIRRKSPL